MLNKKHIILLVYCSIIILPCCDGYGQLVNDQIKKNCLCWNKNLPLHRHHFRNKQIPKEAFKNKSIAALSVLNMQIIPVLNHGKISFIVYNLFNMDSSWISKDTVDHSSILKHEKTHFDIAEVYTRKLRKELSNFLKEYEYDEIKINEIIEGITLQEKIEQESFDNETNLGLNLEKQKQWNDKITQKLEDLKIYSLSPEIDCPCILPSSLRSSSGDLKEQMKGRNCRSMRK